MCFRSLSNWLRLSVVSGLALTGYLPFSAEAQGLPSGMLTATAPVMVAATEVFPLTPNTPSQGQAQPGLLSATSPDALAPGPNTPLDLPLADSSALANGASPTASGSALAGQGGEPTSGKNVVDIGTHRRFQYHFRLSVLETYDDNIFLDQHGKKDDFFTIIEPSVTLGFGDVDERIENFVRFDYALSAFIFAKHGSQDTVQHLLRLDGQYRIAKLTLTASQQVQILNGADLSGIDTGGNQATRTNVDVAGRTGLNIYTTILGANYQLSGKTSVDLGFLFSDSDYDVLISSQTYSANLYFNYALSPKLTLGIGAAGGYVAADNPTPDETFEQGNFRLSYVITQKLSLIGTIGVEGRQSSDRDGTRVTPVFDLSALYQPFDGTTFGISTTRRVLTSAVEGGENYQSTAVSLSLRQRLLNRFTLTLSGGYENDHYVSVISGTTATREDNYYFVQAGLDVSLRDRITAGINYQHRENSSSGSFNTGFNDNQVSARVTVSF